MRPIAAFLASLWIALLFAQVARADQPAIPVFWDARERLAKPDLTGVKRLRFLTTTDFPPFNFLDGSGRLTGFHVDLARAICTELEILDKCQIQALPWRELDAALAAKEGEAIIAGISVTAQTRDRYGFSRAYLQFPARFAARSASPIAEPLYTTSAGKRIGVVAGSAHERMLRDYFPEVKAVTYARQDWVFDDLKAGKIDGTFGDGMRLAFWLSGSDSGACCRFAGGPYLAPEYLGTGLAIAAGKDDPALTQMFDYALQQINVKGIFAELYLRYFPVSFF
ncbi:polar amino acid transport system substrate-binding protein [Mesorhizobium albiziae]|uniref:Polar amino acid transport system substrate-binding protein n=1 Tax=Neomesorhizobium albiziae TaxID=335020 RepID=A0A1I4CK94_9HYPH|nr:transporter substrate-binding domain-containing protein [Mesorhizobium albiziae]GLS29326.1 amino acid ABC transporter [Mesorhizobium albiziae]SFK81684.1 polar amino acid transport system substrate-binding protein [Mesorhizobium albiziae]